MTNYRKPEFIKRYEDVFFELDKALDTNPAGTTHQIRDNIRFIADNSGELTPFDWYNARLNVNFKLQLLADGGGVAANVQSGIVNSAFSLIKQMKIKMNGIQVYDCDNANQAMNIKNLLEYSRGYSKSQGTMSFFI